MGQSGRVTHLFFPRARREIAGMGMGTAKSGDAKGLCGLGFLGFTEKGCLAQF